MKKIFILIAVMTIYMSSTAQEATTSLTSAYQNVAFDFFREVAKAEDGNVCFSPLSVQLALSMVQNGAAGNTLKEMREVLGTAEFPEDEVNEYNRSLTNKLTYRPEFEVDEWDWDNNEENARKAYDAEYPTCELANGIWIRPGVVLLDTFTSLITEFYDAGFDIVDFTTEEGIQVINEWVCQKTHGLIPKVFNEPQSELVTAVLTNALYFKGSWQNKFEEYETKPDSFHLGDGTAIMTDMMTAHSYFNSSVSEKFRTITLPYGYGNFSMTLFVPVKGTDLPELTVDDWKEGITDHYLYNPPYNVKMPKFKIDGDYELGALLQEMGMHDTFIIGIADFSRISDLPTFINRIFQLSKISVDENGTEAAAVTVIEVPGWGGFDSNGASDFNVDRPFYFTIENRKTETVLFVGRVTEVEGAHVKDVSFIDEIHTSPVSHRFYDLQGRKLNQVPDRGLYIQNGKIFIKN